VAALDVDAVTRLVTEAAARAVMPRFRALPENEIETRPGGELVTAADREAEQIITAGLQLILPQVPVVAEEAVAERPGLITALTNAPRAWLVDPLDGTANFVSGSTDFAIMVALVEAGSTVAAWIHRPHDGRTYVAERGAGAYRDHRRLRRNPAPASLETLRGSVLERFLGDRQRGETRTAGGVFATVGPGRRCAGVDYPLIVEGEQDFTVYARTLPWDHAPGVLLLSEAGGTSQRPDGRDYRPAEPGLGLVAAADPETCRRVTAVFRAVYRAPEAIEDEGRR